jgi:predicted Zn-dependent protease
MKTRKDILEEFLVQDPNDSFTRYALALELEKQNGLVAAINQLNEVIVRDPSYVAAYHQLGRMLAHTGAVEDAQATYGRGIEVATASGDQKARLEMQEALEMLKG